MRFRRGHCSRRKLHRYRTYENFAKVITGEWDSKTPLVKGKFKLKGNLLAAVAHLGVYQSLIDSKKAVDWDYGM